MSKKSEKKGPKKSLNVNPSQPAIANAAEPPVAPQIPGTLPNGPLTMSIGLEEPCTIRFGLPDMRASALQLDDLILDAHTEEEQKRQATAFIKRIDAALSMVDDVERGLDPLEKLLQQELTLRHQDLRQVEHLMRQEHPPEASVAPPHNEDHIGEWA